MGWKYQGLHLLSLLKLHWRARHIIEGSQWELRGALAGQARFGQSISAGRGESVAYQLRRNLHRLEKGLSMVPQRPVFAESYILETIALFGKVLALEDPGYAPLKRWGTNVLDAYFAAVGESAVLNQARGEFARLETQIPGQLEPYRSRPLAPEVATCDRERLSAPYVRDLTPLPISIGDMLTLAKRRRSVRTFTQVPVPHELIDQAIDVARYSPSACNRQPFEYRIYDDRQMVRDIAKISIGTDGYAENIPCICVLTGQLRAFPETRDRHLIYIDGSLSAMAFLFALETLGLSSCAINWPELDSTERRLARLLNLAPDERPIMLIAIGYPDPVGKVPYSEKKPVEQLRRYNYIRPKDAEGEAP